jgi:hypothetical protein
VAGTIGVRILASDVVSIEDTVITQFGQQGILDSRTSGNTKLLIRNSVISHNAGTGISQLATGNSTTEIESSSSINNLFGLAAATGNNVMVKRSVFSGNGTGIEADNGAQVNVDDSAISGNATGIQPTGVIRLSNSDLTFNTSFAVNGPSGGTFGNNRISGNAAVGSALTSVSPGQQ